MKYVIPYLVGLTLLGGCSTNGPELTFTPDSSQLMVYEVDGVLKCWIEVFNKSDSPAEIMYGGSEPAVNVVSLPANKVALAPRESVVLETSFPNNSGSAKLEIKVRARWDPGSGTVPAETEYVIPITWTRVRVGHRCLLQERAPGTEYFTGAICDKPSLTTTGVTLGYQDVKWICNPHSFNIKISGGWINSMPLPQCISGPLSCTQFDPLCANCHWVELAPGDCVDLNTLHFTGEGLCKADAATIYVCGEQATDTAANGTLFLSVETIGN